MMIWYLCHKTKAFRYKCQKQCGLDDPCQALSQRLCCWGRQSFRFDFAQSSISAAILILHVSDGGKANLLDLPMYACRSACKAAGTETARVCFLSPVLFFVHGFRIVHSFLFSPVKRFCQLYVGEDPCNETCIFVPITFPERICANIVVFNHNIFAARS